VELIDTWEHFHVNFTVLYPSDDQFTYLRIRGSNDELGNWKTINSMEKSYRNIRILSEKYDREIKPW